MLLPRLQRYDWPTAGQVSWRRLVGLARAPLSPLITFADELETKWVYRSTGEVSALRTEALANLRQLPVEAEPLRLGGQNPALLVKGGYAAERVLLPDLLERRVAELGGTGRLLVGIPRRSLLVARREEEDSPGEHELVRWVASIHRAEQDPEAALTPYTFVVEDGRVVGVAGAGPSVLQYGHDVPADDVTVGRSGDRWVFTAAGPSEDIAQTVIAAVLGLPSDTAVALELRFRDGNGRLHAEIAHFTEFLERRFASLATGSPSPIPRVAEVRAFSGDRRVVSALDPLPEDLIRALGIAAAAICVVVAGADVRQDEIDALAAALRETEDQRLVEAFLRTEMSVGTAVRAALKATVSPLGALDVVNSALDALVDPDEAHTTRRALAHLAGAVASVSSDSARVETPEFRAVAVVMHRLGLVHGSASL